MANDNSRCVVLVPIGHAIEPECERGLNALERQGYIVLKSWGYSAIDQGRNHMATDMLAKGFEELMWIDSDVGFDPADVDRLRSHNLPISCGLYAKKGGHEMAFDPLPGTKQMRFGEGGGLTEIAYGATGFLHTRASLYHQMRQELKLPTCNQRYNYTVVPYFQPLIIDDQQLAGGYRYLGEDFSFMHRARLCGHKIMADTRIRLRHIGRYPYQFEDAGSALSRFQTFDLQVLPPPALRGAPSAS